jgi:hypothetical protein
VSEIRRLREELREESYKARCFEESFLEEQEGRLKAERLLAEVRAKEQAVADRPRVVCLCGSTRFKTEFEAANRDLTLQGYVVLSVGVFAHADGEELMDYQKEALDWLHLRKIDMADHVMVIDVGGYVGESTAREVEYAERAGKTVFFWSGREPINFDAFYASEPARPG